MANKIGVIIQGQNRASGSLRQVQRDSKGLGTSMGNMRLKFLGATAAIAGMGFAIKNVLSAGIEFESAFAGVRKTVDATEEEFAKLEKNFRGLAKQIPISASELAGIGEIAGQLGVRGVTNITKFSKVIAELGITTDISGEQAALSLSRVMNIMGTAQEDIDRFGAAIVELGNNFAARESEIVNISRNLAAFAKQVNLSETELLAFSTTIAASGGEAAAAATAFQTAGIQIEKAVAGGTAKLTRLAEIAGQSTEEFARLFRDDAAQALLAFFRGLQKLESGGESTAIVLGELGLSNARLVREFGKVIANLDDLERALGVSETAWRENLALTEEAEKRYETTASKIQLMTNAFKELKIQAFDNLSPAITRNVEHMTLLLGGMTRNQVKAQDMGIEIENLREKLAKMRTEVGSVTPEQEKMIERFEQMARNAQLAGENFSNWNNQISFSKDAIGAANEALLMMQETMTTMAEQENSILNAGAEEGPLDRMRQKTEEIAAAVREDLGTAMTDFQNDLKAGQEGFKDFNDFITQRLGDQWNTLSGAVKNFSLTVAKQFQTSMSNALSGVILGTKSAGEAFKELGSKMVETVVDYLVELAVAKTVGTLFMKLTTAASLAMAAALASAWAPVAAFVSLATFGSNAGPASAAIGGVNALAAGIAKASTRFAVPALAEGGVVTRPTLALVGERGPEKVIPLDDERAGDFGGGGGITVNISGNVQVRDEEDLRELARLISEEIGDEAEARLRRPVTVG